MLHLPHPSLCVLSLVLAALATWWAWRQTAVGRLLPGVSAGVVATLALLLALVVFRPEAVELQKFITSLLMPAGLVWLGLLLATCWACCRKQTGLTLFLALLWLALMVAGNLLVSRALLAAIESPYQQIDPLAVVDDAAPLDAVVTLGGATGNTPAGQVQVTGGGDRVLLAARLYHRGAAQRLVATGQSHLDPETPELQPAQRAARIWRELAVPDDDIHTIAGRTTSEEIDALAELLTAHPDWQRVGLVTSAFHMARAERLAAAAGLDLVPLPANFRGIMPSWREVSMVPSGTALAETGLVVKEWLAALVGR